MIIETDILYAISQTMTCDKCPHPCEAKEKSSTANCVLHWSKILSNINPDCDWKEVSYSVGYKYANV